MTVPQHTPVRRLRSSLAVGILCALLGFAAVVQVRSQDEGLLERSRRADLVQILDELTSRSQRLEQRVAQLRATRDELVTGADSRAAALAEAAERERVLSILAGTVPVRGPGIVLDISDPNGEWGAAGMLGAVQELRAADAEAISVESRDGGSAVRVVASTSFQDGDGGVIVDGVLLSSPWRIRAIGDQESLGGAMRFPTGVISQVTAEDVGGTAQVDERQEVVVEAVVRPPTLRFARPVEEPNGG